MYLMSIVDTSSMRLNKVIRQVTVQGNRALAEEWDSLRKPVIFTQGRNVGSGAKQTFILESE